MPQPVELIVGPERITFRGPYNPTFAPRARALAGRWNKTDHVWVFDSQVESHVRDLVRRTFGCVTPGQSATRTVQVVLDHSSLSSNEYVFAGQRVLYRATRDAEVRVAPNAVVVEGRLPRTGGSMVHPQILDESYQNETITLHVSGLPEHELAHVTHPYQLVTR